MLAATAAFLAPIALGWAYTGDMSIDMDVLSGHTIDEWNGPEGYEDYMIEREGRNGVITMTVTDPSGNVVPLAELPADVAAEVGYYEHDWEEPESEDENFIDTRDGVSCYLVADIPGAEPGEVNEMHWNENLELVIYEHTLNEDGTITVQATEWADGVLTESELEAFIASGNPADLPAGRELNACDG